MRPSKNVALLIETSNAYARGTAAGRHGLRPRARAVGPPPDRARPRRAGPPRAGRVDRATASSPASRTALIANRLRRCTLPRRGCLRRPPAAQAALGRDRRRGHRPGGRRPPARPRPAQLRLFRRRPLQLVPLAAGGVCTPTSPRPASPATTLRSAAASRLAEWVRSLPKPVGVMACYDIRGRELIDACRAGRGRDSRRSGGDRRR